MATATNLHIFGIDIEFANFLEALAERSVEGAIA
jgi:hypothetical protein